jgi:hypothetical protein
MLQHALGLWASVFSNHASLRTAIDFLHVGGLLGGGGCAVAADRTAIRAARHTRPPFQALDSFQHTHRFVLAGLVAMVASGVLLAAADADTFIHSRVFWVKMGLFALLLVNGRQLLRAERASRAGDARAVRRLGAFAVASLTLWFLTTLAGTALTNLS